MSDTHDYQTVFIHIPLITSEHVLVGECGGLSAAFGYKGHNAMVGHIIETEHGFLVFGYELDMVEVLDE